MRLALGERGLAHRRSGGEAGEPRRIVDEARRMAAQQLAGNAAEMLGEPRLPRHDKAIADLIDGARLGSLPAAHPPGVAALAAPHPPDEERAPAVAAARPPHRPLP